MEPARWAPLSGGSDIRTSPATPPPPPSGPACALPQGGQQFTPGLAPKQPPAWGGNTGTRARNQASPAPTETVSEQVGGLGVRVPAQNTMIGENEVETEAAKGTGTRRGKGRSEADGKVWCGWDARLMTTQETRNAGAGAGAEGGREQSGAAGMVPSRGGRASRPGAQAEEASPPGPGPGLKMNRSRTRQEVGVCSLACALPLGKRPARGASEWVLTAEAWLPG